MAAPQGRTGLFLRVISFVGHPRFIALPSVQRRPDENPSMNTTTMRQLANARNCDTLSLRRVSSGLPAVPLRPRNHASPSVVTIAMAQQLPPERGVDAEGASGWRAWAASGGARRCGRAGGRVSRPLAGGGNDDPLGPVAKFGVGGAKSTIRLPYTFPMRIMAAS